MALTPERFEAFGVRLEALAEEHLELVRAWRNHPDVAQYMVSQEHIARTAHRRWFERQRQTGEQATLVAYFRDRPIAVVYLKTPDGLPLAGHPCPASGLYLAPNELRGSMLAFLPALALHELAFGPLSCGRLDATVLASNQAAQRFNRALGYVDSMPASPDPRWLSLTLSREAHAQARARFARFAKDTP